MGVLSQREFEDLVGAGCPSCNGRLLDIDAVIDRSVVVMVGDPNDEGRWAHTGERFVDGTYRITCVTCAHVMFASDVCPRCNAPGALDQVLARDSRLVVPKRCPNCNELELLAVALVPARARYTVGETPKPKPLAGYAEPGYHVVAYACPACDNATVAECCPLCDAPGPLRQRP